MTHAGQLRSPSPTSLSHHPAPEQALRLTGEMDLATADSLHGQFVEHLRLSASRVVSIDLPAVSFMDCAGLRSLERESRWLGEQGREVRLLGVSAAVERLFTALENCGLSPVHDIEQRTEGNDDMEASAELIVVVPGLKMTQAGSLRREQRDRALIQQAQGLLMAIHECDKDVAEAMLLEFSERHDVDVRSLAEGLVEFSSARGKHSKASDFDPSMGVAVMDCSDRPSEGCPACHRSGAHVMTNTGPSAILAAADGPARVMEELQPHQLPRPSWPVPRLLHAQRNGGLPHASSVKTRRLPRRVYADQGCSRLLAAAGTSPARRATYS